MTCLWYRFRNVSAVIYLLDGSPRFTMDCRVISIRSQSRTNGYLAFLGRICPEKRPDRAIQIAKYAGLDT